MCSTIPHSGPGLDNRATDRKRKNSFDTYESSLICPTVKRTNVANHDISSIPCYDNDSGAINNSTFDIRIISPTHKGISEAARIMRVRSSSSAISGIVSIPTETHYSLLRFVPFQKPTSSSTRTGQDTCRQAWDTMSSIRSMEPTGAPPSVYLYHPIGAYNFVAFSCRKSFVYRQRSSSSDSEKSAKSTSSTETTHIKITFSESHEVLNRLSSAFWPGTVTIFAPVRTRRLKNRDEQGRTITRINGHDSMESLSSITSLSSEENEDSSPDIVQLASPSVPVVPDSFLCSERELHIPDGGDKKNFIGMRCPSHPIARKILSEAYAQDDGNLAIPLTGAIVGVNAPTSENTCKGVYSTLQSCVSDPDATEDKKPIIHIMNGEDRHEMFSVPPCQFGELPSVSLVLDTPRRNIILLRNNRTDPASNKIPAAAFNFDIRAQEVRRALCNLSKNSVEARAIAAVMSKWRVTEIQL